MSELTRTFRHALRRLARRPGFTAAAVATLALGIGANVAVFSAVETVLLAPLPYPQPDRLAEVRVVGKDIATLSAPDFVDLRDDADAFDGLFAAARVAPTLSDPQNDGGQPAELAQGFAVSEDFFHVIGVNPSMGRPFTPDEMSDPAARAVVLGHDLWQRRYGGDPGVIGRRIEVDGEPTVIAGVMPQGFSFPEGSEIWEPLPLPRGDLGRRGTNYLQVYGRLTPGATVDGANAQAEAIAARLEAAWPDSNTGKNLQVRSLREAVVGDYRPALLMLLGASGLVLLIACANVANLLIARMIERRRELAVRSALGAASSGLLRLVLAESLLLALFGGLAALAVGWAGIELLTSVQALEIPRLADASLDAPALLFCLGLTALTALVAGGVPALRLGSSRSLHAALLASGRATGDRGSHRLRGLLVATEITLAVVLLFGAGLLGRSFLELQQVDPGFEPRGALTFFTTLNETDYPESAQRVAFTDRLLERLETIPGVERAGLILGLPLSGPNMVIRIEELDGAPAYDEPSDAKSLRVRPITSGALEALGIPVIVGRGLTDHDRPGAAPVVLVNETAAKTLWPEAATALGHTIRIGAEIDGTPVGGEVIGVVGDIHGSSLAERPIPELYVPYRALPFQFFTVVLRTQGDPLHLTIPARAAIQELDPKLAVYRVQTMDHLLDGSLAQNRLYALLLTVFAATALTLAGVGIYGVVSYVASQRTREMGIRMALGASRKRVLGLMLTQGLGTALFGAAAGILVALSLGGVLRTWLYGLEPTDPLTLVASAAILTAVTLLASLAPARKASHTDPAVTLREE